MRVTILPTCIELNSGSNTFSLVKVTLNQYAVAGDNVAIYSYPSLLINSSLKIHQDLCVALLQALFCGLTL